MPTHSFFHRSVARVVRSLMVTVLTALMAGLSPGCTQDDPDRDDHLATGDLMPRFEVVTTSCDTVSNVSLEGHVAVIVFFSTSCPDCQRQLPQLQQVYASMTRSEATWICIARAEGRESVERFWSDYALTMPVAPQSDRSVYSRFASSGVPRVYIFGRDGRLLSSLGGYTDIDMAEVISAIHEAG